MRLIDADVFRRFAHEQLENDKLYSADDILEMIDEQPTAYNVEAVAKELEKESFVVEVDYDFDEEDEGSVECVFTEQAIETVRRGGVK